MYLKKDDLKNLITSLSSEEKKYFNQHIKSLSHQKMPYYLALFSALIQGKSQLAELPEMRSDKAQTNAKSRLYQQLLQSLRHYHEEQSIDMIIQNLLCEIEILYNRGLPEQSLVLLKKAHANALIHENYGLMLQILLWERKLNLILNTPTRTNNEIATEEKSILKNLHQIIELENIYSKVIEIKKRNGYVKGAARENLDQVTVKNLFLVDEYTHTSKRGKYYYHFIYALYYWLTLDHEQAYLHSKELLAPEMQQIAPNEYLDGILQHVTSCMGLAYFEETLDGLLLADAFVLQEKFHHSTSFLIRAFYFRVCYKLIVYSYMGDLDQLQATIQETETQIQLYDKQLSIEMKLVIYGNLRNAYIASGAFDKAEKLLDILLYKESKFVRSDVYNDLFLSRVFSHLASGTYVLVPAMALTSHRQYKQTKSDKTPLEVGLKITSILMKEYNYEDPQVRKSVLLHLKEVLQQHITSIAGTNNFQEMYTFYLIWTNSMLQQQPFAVAAAEWYQSHLDYLAKN